MRRRKRNRKKDKIMLTPLQTTEALQTIGEEFDRKRAMLYYTGLLFVAIILGLLFELNHVKRPIVAFTNYLEMHNDDVVDLC